MRSPPGHQHNAAVLVPVPLQDFVQIDFWKQLAKIGNTIVSQLVSLVIIVGTIIAILAYLKGIKP
jgi:hypothetical protein